MARLIQPGRAGGGNGGMSRGAVCGMLYQTGRIASCTVHSRVPPAQSPNPMSEARTRNTSGWDENESVHVAVKPGSMAATRSIPSDTKHNFDSQAPFGKAGHMRGIRASTKVVNSVPKAEVFTDVGLTVCGSIDDGSVESHDGEAWW